MSYNKDRNHRSRFLPNNLSVDNLKVPPEEALNVDLKEVVIPGVYPDKLNGDFSKTYLVQIKKIVEIGPNKVLNGGGSHHRSLLLHLSDGHVSHKALEVGEIPGLSLNTRPGTKVILFGPKLKIVGNSFMYLDSTMAQVVGGGISELNAKWEMTKSLENRCRDNTSREGGPPAWAPFGKKINKDSLKVAKVSAPVKEEKKNPAFESQRKDAILTATRSSQPKKSNSEENTIKIEKNGKNNRNQSQRQNFNKADTGSSQAHRKSVPTQNSSSNKSTDKEPNESTSQPQINNYNNHYRRNSPKHNTPKEPIRIAQKEYPVQAKHDSVKDIGVKSSFHEPAPVKSSFHEPAPVKSSFHEPAPVKSSFHEPAPVKSSFHDPAPFKSSFHEPPTVKSSFHEQFLQPPPNYTNSHQENAQWGSKTYSNSSYMKNQPDITPSHNAATDIASFPIQTQPYTASSYSDSLPNPSFAQNDYYIQNSIPSKTRNDFDYKSIPLPSQSHVPFPSNPYPPDVNHIQNYGNTGYFDASLQPPLSAYKKNDYAENCIPSQTLVFTGSAFSDGQTPNPIPGYAPSSYDPSKVSYSRTQFSEPPPNSYDSHSYRSNLVDGSLQNWIPQAETDNEIQPYQYLKTNYSVVPSQSPPVQLEYDNQTQMYSRSNFSNTNNNPQKLQNECLAPYQMNTMNSNESSQNQVQKYDNNSYVPQPYVYNRRGNFSGGGTFQRKNNEESFSASNSRGYQRQYTRPPFKMNERPRAPNMRGSRGRGFSYPGQPRFSGPPPQQAGLSEYLDNKLHLNTG